MTRTYRIYVCTPDKFLFKVDLEASCPNSAEAQVRLAFRDHDLPADVAFYRSAV